MVANYPPGITLRPKRPSLPTVISLIALFVALGGTSYAVIKLPASSVGTRELKRNAVTSSKVRDGAIGPSKLSDAAEGRRGPRGPQGPPGQPGSPGSAGALATPEEWRVLPYAGSWTNYGSGHITGAFRKDPFGRVELRGLASKNGGAPVSGDVIAKLPTGYRPPARMVFTVASGGGANVYGRVDVLANGDVVWVAGGTAEVDFSSLSQIGFWTDP